jgi:uncharacterized pyridoxal phosphate-containing UPF0001 family protein
LQVHIATESSKFGFGINELEDTLIAVQEFKNINIKGLMGMATFTNDRTQIRKEFSNLEMVFNQIKTPQINTLSIGMSGDYKIAIENGSTMIRIGSAIFGAR